MKKIKIALLIPLFALIITNKVYAFTEIARTPIESALLRGLKITQYIMIVVAFVFIIKLIFQRGKRKKNLMYVTISILIALILLIILKIVQY